MSGLRLLLLPYLLCRLITLHTMADKIFYDNRHEPFIRYNVEKTASFYNDQKVWVKLADNEFDDVLETPHFIVLVGKLELGISILADRETKELRRVNGSVFQVSSDGSSALTMQKYTPMDSTKDYLWTSLISCNQKSEFPRPLVSCTAWIRCIERANGLCDSFEIKNKSGIEDNFYGAVTYNASLYRNEKHPEIESFLIEVVCQNKKYVFLFDIHTGELLEKSIVDDLDDATRFSL